MPGPPDRRPARLWPASQVWPTAGRVGRSAVPGACGTSRRRQPPADLLQKIELLLVGVVEGFARSSARSRALFALDLKIIVSAATSPLRVPSLDGSVSQPRVTRCRRIRHYSSPMFGLGKKDSAPDGATEELADSHSAEQSVGKGRPTPTRKEAEQARRAAPQRPRRSQSTAQTRTRGRPAIAGSRHVRRSWPAMNGPFPPAMPGRFAKYVRNYIDGRRTLAEYFIPLAVVVLIVGLFRSPNIQVIVSFAWFLMLALLVVDMTVLLFRLRSNLAREFPDPAQRKGAIFYAAMRALQIRRLRLPPPKVKAGGKPVTRKVK